MHILYNCKGEAVAKYRTEKGLNIGISKRKCALWAMFDKTPVEERKEHNLIYYTRIEQCILKEHSSLVLFWGSIINTLTKEVHYDQSNEIYP